MSILTLRPILGPRWPPSVWHTPPRRRSLLHNNHLLLNRPARIWAAAHGPWSARFG